MSIADIPTTSERVGVSTYFAPAMRLGSDELRSQCQAVIDSAVVRAVLDAVGGHAMVLSDTRQILGVNEGLTEALGIVDPICSVGLRPGELLACLHVNDAPSGCGTGLACRSCGAVLAILAAQAKDRCVDGECSLLRQGAAGLEAMELKVRATPMTVAGHRVTVLVLQDISGAKRRDVLERMFLHDMQNALTGLVGLGELAREGASVELTGQIVELALELSDELRAQRTLMDAEQGTLPVDPTARTGRAVVASLVDKVVRHRDRVQAVSLAPDELVECDQRLLSRVLLNMVVNALEASGPTGHVTVRHTFEDGCHLFSVHNDGVIAPEVQPRVFHRSFSTKSSVGRGLGTYGMKLLGERYLCGKVWFESKPEVGTFFYLSLPAAV